MSSRRGKSKSSRKNRASRGKGQPSPQQTPLFAAFALVWGHSDARSSSLLNQMFAIFDRMTPAELEQHVKSGLLWLGRQASRMDMSSVDVRGALRFLQEVAEEEESDDHWSRIVAVPVSGNRETLVAMGKNLHQAPTHLPPGPFFPEGARVEWLDQSLLLPTVFEMGFIARDALLKGTLDVASANLNRVFADAQDGPGSNSSQENPDVAVVSTRLMVGVVRAPFPPESEKEEEHPDWLWHDTLAEIDGVLEDHTDEQAAAWLDAREAAQEVLRSALRRSVPDGATPPMVGDTGTLSSALAEGAASMLLLTFEVDRTVSSLPSSPEKRACIAHLSPSLDEDVMRLTLEEKGVDEGQPPRWWGPYDCPTALMLENEDRFCETLETYLGKDSSVELHDAPFAPPSASSPPRRKLH